MTTKFPVYQAKITGSNDTGIFALSFVENPANESNFVALATAAQRPVKLSLDRMKQVLTGAVLVPDQMIYRNDNQLGEYYLQFAAQDIEKIRDEMMRNGAALSTTTHEHETPLTGNHLVECWIVEDPMRDKSVALGLGPYKKGTLVASYKVGDAVYWRTQVLAGKVKGFSIEGFFNFKTVTMSKPQVKASTILPGKKSGGGAIATMLRSIATALDGDTASEAKDLTGVAKDDETNSGTPYIVFDLQDGTEIDVDSTGFCTLSDGTQAPAGDHTLLDGNTISIGDDGMLAGTTDVADAPAPAAAPAALTAEQKLAREEAKKRGVAASALLKKAAEDAAKKNPQAKQIAALKAQLAELEKQPSADPAKPTPEGGGTNITERVVAKMKGHERAAIMLKDKLARKNK